MNKIFIPKKCRVGFQEREDTFAKKLAYVIYYDAKGKLRKEPSWEQWRHKPGQEIGGYDYTISKPTKRPLNVCPYLYPWYFETEDEKVYFFEPLKKEISVEDMQKIVDANEKLVKELKDEYSKF